MDPFFCNKMSIFLRDESAHINDVIYTLFHGEYGWHSEYVGAHVYFWKEIRENRSLAPPVRIINEKTVRSTSADHVK